MSRLRRKIRFWLVSCGLVAALPLFVVGRPHDATPCSCCTTSEPHADPSAFVGADETGGRAQRPMPAGAKAALEQLLEGNRRFAAGKPQHKHITTEWRAQIAKNQKPIATILGCADSRVPPELVFDQGLGDLFVVRLAGAVVDSDVSGSLEYAGRHLGTQLFVVLGHEQCGAVTAVVAAADENKEPPGLEKLLQRIRPSLKGIDPNLTKDRRIAAAVEANVRWSMRQLRTVPEHKKVLDDGKVTLVGAVYELDTGKVRVLE